MGFEVAAILGQEQATRSLHSTCQGSGSARMVLVQLLTLNGRDFLLILVTFLAWHMFLSWKCARVGHVRNPWHFRGLHISWNILERACQGMAATKVVLFSV